jgi:steroid 5-alpha reductase family enzyme
MNTHIFWNAFLGAVAQAGLLIFVMMSIFFLYALLKKRNDIADIIWGIGFIIVAWFTLYSFGFRVQFLPEVYGPLKIQSLLVAGMVTLWGVRLATHIALRNAHKEEDFRYAQWREQWGKWFIPRSYLQIFMLQGFLMLLISLPVISVMVFGGTTISVLTGVGFCIWLIGFLFESVGDYQLKKFIANPENKGKIMTSGLWSYTRHPNYFGEVTGWWGVYIATVPVFTLVQAVPYLYILTLVGPLTITFLILKVSGIPMLEKKYDSNIEFQEYKKRTSAFFPWFPKR